jgi:hypothetical protein
LRLADPRMSQVVRSVIVTALVPLSVLVAALTVSRAINLAT